MKTLGLDLGTNSIGWAIRDTSNQEGSQFVNKGVIVFKTGVAKDNKGYFSQSLAAERRKKRSARRRYQARLYRKYATLEALVKHKLCPLDAEDVNKWKHYTKPEKYGEPTHIYPQSEAFDRWIKLDFNNDGMPDYTSPYQLRAEIANSQLELDNEIDRYKLGRALYHIAQRRGFKSSKGDTAKEQTENANIDSDEAPLKKSEENKAKQIKNYIELRKEHIGELKTLGCVLADVENNPLIAREYVKSLSVNSKNKEDQKAATFDGGRIRETWNQWAIRGLYVEEVDYIFEFQDELEKDSKMHKDIKKAIFFQRPLRSQKGLVGKCTFEKSKPRCPISRPEFEEFRAWQVINNIRYFENDSWEPLESELKQKIYEKFFLKMKNDFKFGIDDDNDKKSKNKKSKNDNNIETFICKEMQDANLQLNYKSNKSISACPVTARLKGLLGDDWKTKKNESGKGLLWEDIWHLWFSADNEDYLYEYVDKHNDFLNFNETQRKSFITGLSKLPIGYARLSLKAINNIKKIMLKGKMYTDAVLLAKVPDLLGEELFEQNEEDIDDIIRFNRENKKIYEVVNSLISEYKEKKRENTHKRLTNYKLNYNDFQDIDKKIESVFGKKSFHNMERGEQDSIKEKVKNKYEEFLLKNSKDDYLILPRVIDSLQNFIKEKGGDSIKKKYKIPDDYIEQKKVKKKIEKDDKEVEIEVDINVERKPLDEFLTNKLYHPSINDIYPYAENDLLDSPATDAFRNPMAMRTLHELHKLINYLLKQGDISTNKDETRIVVELARDLNDTNKRVAIQKYQEEREKENKEYKKEIEKYGITPTNNDIEKYRLWKEQKEICIYTGKLISFSALFDGTSFDVEHTIPYSQCFDDSLANKTICESNFNRNIKKNQLPKNISHPDYDYSQTKARLQDWKKIRDDLDNEIENNEHKTKRATTKEIKDKMIQDRHIAQRKLNYWKNKIERFEMIEVKSNFKHSQLTDTQLISRWAVAYLKTLFERVSVQRGENTAKFRKIFGIQGIGEEKNRGTHIHHAKDAAVLTLIPDSRRRENILFEYGEWEEKKKKREQVPSVFPMKPYDYPNFDEKHIREFEDTILVNNIVRDFIFCKHILFRQLTTLIFLLPPILHRFYFSTAVQRCRQL
jgi:CRISPR-associated endonuclease Csn1